MNSTKNMEGFLKWCDFVKKDAVTSGDLLNMMFKYFEKESGKMTIHNNISLFGEYGDLNSDTFATVMNTFEDTLMRMYVHSCLTVPDRIMGLDEEIDVLIQDIKQLCKCVYIMSYKLETHPEYHRGIAEMFQYLFKPAFLVDYDLENESSIGKFIECSVVKLKVLRAFVKDLELTGPLKDKIDTMIDLFLKYPEGGKYEIIRNKDELINWMSSLAKGLVSIDALLRTGLIYSKNGRMFLCNNLNNDTGIVNISTMEEFISNVSEYSKVSSKYRVMDMDFRGKHDSSFESSNFAICSNIRSVETYLPSDIFKNVELVNDLFEYYNIPFRLIDNKTIHKVVGNIPRPLFFDEKLSNDITSRGIDILKSMRKERDDDTKE